MKRIVKNIFRQQQTYSQEQLKNQIWLNVEEFPLYQVSNLGRVKSLARDTKAGLYGQIQHRPERILSGAVDAQGYLFVRIPKEIGGKYYLRKIHNLVADAFIGKSNLFVDHINNRKRDNRASNLRYITNSENIVKSIRYKDSLQKSVKTYEEFGYKATYNIFISSRKGFAAIIQNNKSKILVRYLDPSIQNLFLDKSINWQKYRLFHPVKSVTKISLNEEITDQIIQKLK